MSSMLTLYHSWHSRAAPAGTRMCFVTALNNTQKGPSHCKPLLLPMPTAEMVTCCLERVYAKLECWQTSGGAYLFLHYGECLGGGDIWNEEDAVQEMNSLSSWQEFV